MRDLRNPIHFLLIILLIPAFSRIVGQGIEQSIPDTDSVIISWFETRPGIILPKEETEISALIYNSSTDLLKGLTASIEVPEGIQVNAGTNTQFMDLRPQEVKRLVWQATAKKAGSFKLALTVRTGSDSTLSIRSLAVVTHRDPRHEYLNTIGSWDILSPASYSPGKKYK